MPNICAIDFGVSNFAAVVCNDGSSMLYKGGAVLSECQWFHKKRAKAVSIITKGHEHMHASSRYLSTLSRHHADFIASPEVSGFHELNPLSISVKGIAAA